MTEEYKYVVFCGQYEVMNAIAEKGARALNPENHKYQIIDENAKYEIVKDENGFYELRSNKDLRKIAQENGLII